MTGADVHIDDQRDAAQARMPTTPRPIDVADAERGELSTWIRRSDGGELAMPFGGFGQSGLGHDRSRRAGHAHERRFTLGRREN